MFLYFVEAGDAIKVGITGNMEDRVRTIQVSNPEKVKVLHHVKLTAQEAHKMEKEIHRLFYKTNLRGEWFQSTRFMKRYIKNIKENGLFSHSEWVKQEYERTYGEIFKKIEKAIEIDVIQGNLLSLEFFKRNIGYLINTTFPSISVPSGMGVSQSLKNWIDRLAPGTFRVQHIYKDLGINSRKDKHHIVVALSRIVKESKAINKLGHNYYRKAVLL